MIFDTVEHVKNYQGLGRVYEALEFLASTDFSGLPTGKQELDGDNLFYMIQEYETEPANCRQAEGHFKYIDIQAVLCGEEVIGVAPITAEKTMTKDCRESDYCLYECETQPILMRPGYFLVLYPNDLHKPCCCVDSPAKCRKVVIKIKCD